MVRGTGMHCGNADCQASLGIASIQVQVENQLRAAINKFYEGWLVCDDASCGNRTRMLSVVGRRCLKPDCRGRMHNEVGPQIPIKNHAKKMTDIMCYSIRIRGYIIRCYTSCHYSTRKRHE